MPSKVYKEYKSYTFRETLKPKKCLDLMPLEEKEIYRSFEVIPYKPPHVYRSSVTMFMSEKRKPAKTLIIPVQRYTLVSPPKKSMANAFKCVTYTVNEFKQY